MRNKKRWSEMSNPQRAVVVATAIVQISLAAAAWADTESVRRAERCHTP